jgi:hypothetical protein
MISTTEVGARSQQCRFACASSSGRRSSRTRDALSVPHQCGRERPGSRSGRRAARGRPPVAACAPLSGIGARPLREAGTLPRVRQHRHIPRKQRRSPKPSVGLEPTTPSLPNPRHRLTANVPYLWAFGGRGAASATPERHLMFRQCSARFRATSTNSATAEVVDQDAVRAS